MGNSARTRHPIVSLSVLALLAACSEEPRPPTAMEFMENPTLLDATIVRCVENREDLRYEAECINARDAVDLIAVKAEKARRAELEAESERKREALRAAQEAVDEARRRTLEAERLRTEAELLGLAVVPVPDAGDTAVPAGTVMPDSETPDSVIPGSAMPQAVAPGAPDSEAAAAVSATGQVTDVPATAAPMNATAPVPDESPAKTDLEAVPEELQQRQEDAPTQPAGQQPTTR